MARSGKYIVTPEQAELWLADARENRPLSSLKIRQYSESMKLQEWAYNGEPLIFNNDGCLIDGQHRLRACVISKKPFETYCVFGVSDGATATIDTGKARSPGDALQILRGTKNPKHLAAMINFLWLYDTNTLVTDSGKKSIPRSILLEYHDKHPHLDRSLPIGSSMRRLFSPGISGALHYLMSQKDAELATTFFHQLSHGEGLYQGEGLYLLRHKLQRDHGAKKHATFARKAAWIIKVWNDYRSGRKKRASLHWRRSIQNINEPFPVIK